MFLFFLADKADEADRKKKVKDDQREENAENKRRAQAKKKDENDAKKKKLAAEKKIKADKTGMEMHDDATFLVKTRS